MTHEYINELLEQQGENPVLLDGCVLNITDGRSIIYILSGDTDYEHRELEICYADNHGDAVWKGTVKTKKELEKVVLENLNISDVSVRSNNIYEFEHLIYYQKEYDDFIINGDFDKISKYSLTELDNFDIKIEYNSWSDLDKLPKFIILKCNYNEKLLEVKFQTKYDFFDGNYHLFIDKLISIKPI